MFSLKATVKTLPREIARMNVSFKLRVNSIFSSRNETGLSVSKINSQIN